MSPPEVLFRISDLHVSIPVPGGTVRAVRGVDLAVAAGETLALVGESGCGKSVSLYSAFGLLPRQTGARVEGSVHYDGRELLGRSAAWLNRVRGSEIGMIFQDAVAALNPTMTVGAQIAEPLRYHRGMRRRQALSVAEGLLEQCRIPAPARRLKQYPFELSGGMAQRVMIAMALACGPRLLIADEPTTALDVTTQAQILGLLAELCRDRDMAMILVTHDLGVVARMADQVAVMYAGEILETAPVATLFSRPAHPYTQALLRATPDARVAHGGQLQSIPGFPPDLFAPPAGCGFHPRCERVMRLCPREHPPLIAVSDDGSARCWLHHPDCPGAES